MEKTTENENEETLSSLIFSFCDHNFHSRLKQEDVCLEKDCPLYKKISCPQCFQKHSNSHKRFNIRVILDFILQSLKFESEITDIPSYPEINFYLQKIDEKINELEKIKQDLRQLSNHYTEAINEIKEKFHTACDTLKKIISKQQNEDIIPLVLNFLCNVENNDGNLTMVIDNKILKELEEKIEKTLHKANSFFPITNTKNTIQNLSKSNEENSFCFDLTNTGPSIKFKSKFIATKISSNGFNESICFTIPSLTKYSKIQYKIGECKWVGIGICKMQFIKNISYSFHYSRKKMERGFYVISNNGYSWSDYDDNEHNQLNVFKFRKSDVIELVFDPLSKILTFIKNKNEMKCLNFEWPIEDSYVFCGVLNNIEDSLIIL